MKIIVLHKHNGEHQLWSEIDEDSLELLLKVGSLDGGDRLVYPKSIKHIVEKCSFEIVNGWDAK